MKFYEAHLQINALGVALFPLEKTLSKPVKLAAQQCVARNWRSASLTLNAAVSQFTQLFRYKAFNS